MARVAAADSYRSELLIADGAAVIGGNIAFRVGVGGPLAFSGLLVSGPIAHAAHGNFPRAAGSLAMRSGAAFIAYVLLGRCADRRAEPDVSSVTCGAGSLLAGSLLGATALAIDYAVLGKDHERDTSARVVLRWQVQF